MKKINALLLSTIAVLIFCSTSASAKDKVLEGEYIPVSGWAKSMEVSRPDLGELPSQLGKFKLKLERLGWDDLSDEEQDRIAEKITIEGVFRGAVNSSFSLGHTFTNKKRTGIMYTQGDVFDPTQGDQVCSQGAPLAGTETLKFVKGIGDYAALQPNTGQIVVTGVINNCPGQPNFLQNDFVVEKAMGSLIFETE